MTIETSGVMATDAENQDVSASCDSQWLLSELQRSFDLSTKHIVRMAAIVRRLDDLGAQIDIQSSVLPYLRKIAHGNLSADLFVAMQGYKTMLDVASTLPTPVQLQIAKNEPLKVMSTNGDFRMVPPLSMTTKEISQVFAKGRIRDEAEQVGIHRQSLENRTHLARHPSRETVRLDRKKKGIFVGETFVSLIEIEYFYNELNKKK